MRRLVWLPARCRAAGERSSSLAAVAEVLLRERGVLLACGGLASQGRHPVLTVEAVLDQDSGCCGARPAPAATHVVQARQHAGREVHRDRLGPGFLHVRHSTAECRSRGPGRSPLADTYMGSLTHRQPWASSQTGRTIVASAV